MLAAIAAGQTLVMLTGGVDLSVATTATAAAFTVPRVGEHGAGAAISTMALVIGLVIGLVRRISCPHARDELVRAERLGEVIVGADVEADDAVGLLGTRGDHDDRRSRSPGRARSARHTSRPLMPGSMMSRMTRSTGGAG